MTCILGTHFFYDTHFVTVYDGRNVINTKKKLCWKKCIH